ncbi:MAG TPA: hypothetical protein VMW76_04680 [Bacteroidales bacterium]|nr:hypothetical protein [Bacteroidales bacterium]
MAIFLIDCMLNDFEAAKVILLTRIFVDLNKINRKVTHIPRILNLLIISGTGRKSGKTTLACRIIEHFREVEPVAVKISFHFHEPSPGLVLCEDMHGYRIYRETCREGLKDTSRMLNAGAGEVYYIQADDSNVSEAFLHLLKVLKPGAPLICESPALRKYFKPGLFFIADNKNISNRKDPGKLVGLADYIKEISDTQYLPEKLEYSDGRWIIT